MSINQVVKWNPEGRNLDDDNSLYFQKNRGGVYLERVKLWILRLYYVLRFPESKMKYLVNALFIGPQAFDISELLKDDKDEDLFDKLVEPSRWKRFNNWLNKYPALGFIHGRSEKEIEEQVREVEEMNRNGIQYFVRNPGEVPIIYRRGRAQGMCRNKSELPPSF